MLFCEKALRKCTLSAFIERAINGSLVMSKELQITDLHPGEGKEASKVR
ncbi:Peptidyl-prolyl cis-trans isomerase [Pseudomonas amygdali pv. aesculi]|nr:Peptidyl-prolyl cis-trans isomerase [Pseudomonas amygdali pv. aesculi]